MDKRIKIGILYSYNENWIGGTYYYQYLIQSLNLLADDKKPHIVIVGTSDESFDSVKKLNYPYITYQKIREYPYLLTRVFNRMGRKISPKLVFPRTKFNFGIDVLFHPIELIVANSIKKHLVWIPDLQELHLPHLFSKEVLEFRKKIQLAKQSTKDNLLFSSEDAYIDFKTLYPKAKSNCFVVNFVVFHPDYSKITYPNLRAKYTIGETKYFFSPNQFWQHKNQIVILKALKILKENKGLKTHFKVLFSGKNYDPRNLDYFVGIQQYVNENNLQDHVEFLGFIDREEQLFFMKNAMAVIQPSLFEGWSSTVEDTKAMNQNLIVSELRVHKDQLKEQAFYFDPNNEIQLASIMQMFLEEDVKKPEFNYSHNLDQFGKDFMDVIIKIV